MDSHAGLNDDLLGDENRSQLAHNLGETLLKSTRNLSYVRVPIGAAYHLHVVPLSLQN